MNRRGRPALHYVLFALPTFTSRPLLGIIAHAIRAGKMGAKGICYGVLLANQQMPRAMEHQAALLLGGLSLNMVGRRTASHIASASMASFFCRLT
jgi:hypothetical protein